MDVGQLQPLFPKSLVMSLKMVLAFFPTLITVKVIVMITTTIFKQDRCCSLTNIPTTCFEYKKLHQRRQWITHQLLLKLLHHPVQ